MRLYQVAMILIPLFTVSIMSSSFHFTVFGTSVAANNMTTTSYNMTTTSNSNASVMQPTVIFPTQEEVSAYNMELGAEIIRLSNSSLGDASSVKATSKGNETFIVWLEKIDGINRVFYSVTRDQGANYTQPLELSPPSSGNASNLNASNLQLEVYDSFVDVVWQSTDPTNGTSNIVGSVSMDNGHSFKTYQLNAEGTNARDPILAGNFIVAWMQEEPCPPQQGGNDNTCSTVDLRFRW